MSFFFATVEDGDALRVYFGDRLFQRNRFGDDWIDMAFVFRGYQPGDRVLVGELVIPERATAIFFGSLRQFKNFARRGMSSALLDPRLVIQ